MTASYRRVLTNGPFARMVIGHGLATLGQLQLTMAVGIDVLDRTNSGVWVSAAVALGFAPYVLFSAPAGVLADRHSRSTVLRTSIGIRVVTGSLTTAGLVLGWPIPLIVALAALTAVAATPSYPAVGAATPQLVQDRDLPAANSLATGVENTAWVAGPGLLGLVLLVGAPVAGGGVAATACFALALIGLGRTRTPVPARDRPAAAATDGGLLGGVRVIAADSRIRAALVLAIINNMLYGYLVVALVLLGERAFRAGEQGIGWLNAAFAVGAFTSIAVAPRFGSGGREPRMLLIATVLFAATAVGAALAPGLGVAVVFILCAGLLTLVAEIVAVTLIQRLTPDAVTARVLGIYDTLAVAAIAVASGLAGVLSEAIGVRVALLLASAVTIGLTVVCVPALRTATLSLGSGGILSPAPEEEG